MDHGLQAFFLERARFRRRLALIIVAVSAAFAAPYLLTLAPAARAPMQQAVDEAMRFGFEGPELYVRRIELQVYGSGTRTTGPEPVRPVIVPEGRRGGGGRATAEDDGRFREVVRPGPTGPGQSDADIMARALLRAGDMPVFRSEELVIEHLVRPAYPDAARDLGLEGRVVIMALVDTFGTVGEAELMGGDPDGPLEQAALAAVRATRFRPFIVRGQRRSVWAVFRFVFRLLG
jgi:TonB family protein